MYTVYDQLDDPEQIAKVGIMASCEFDNACGLPMSIYSLKLKPKAAAEAANALTEATS